MKLNNGHTSSDPGVHLDCPWIVLAGSVLLFAVPAMGAQIKWSGGGNELTMKAQRCTLDVVFTPEGGLRHGRVSFA